MGYLKKKRDAEVHRAKRVMVAYALYPQRIVYGYNPAVFESNRKFLQDFRDNSLWVV